MLLKQILITLTLLLLSCNSFAEEKSNTSSRIGIDLGIAYDLDLGVSAQYKGYTFFVNGDSAALDVRVQNFNNDRKTVHFYVDLGGFVKNYNGNDSTQDDSAGIRAPIGMTFGLERNLEAYIQAVPSYDFSNDKGFSIDGAVGIRYRF